MRYLSTKRQHHHFSAGFTITELIVVITVSIILTSMLFGPLNDLYQDNNRSLKNIVKVADTRGALRSIEHNITLAYAFDDAVVDHTGTSWSWTGTDSTHRVLITQNYATTINENQDPTGTRQLLFASPGCTTPLLNTYIYFVNNSTLYRRLMKSTQTACSGSIAQVQTCATACPGVDAAILTGVTSFTVDYYATASDTSVMPNEYTSNVVPGAAKAIVVTLAAKSGNGAIDTLSTQSLRIARVNGT